MKTAKLYNTNSYETMWKSVITDYTTYDGKRAVVFEETIFFPEGGGQSGDVGTIEIEGQFYRIVDTQEKEDIVYHLLEEEALLKVGKSVTLRIDWKQRFSNMQQHTGEHILSGLAHTLYGVENVGFHLGKDVVRVDFDRTINEQELKELEHRANGAIIENIAIKTDIYNKETAQEVSYRSKKELDGEIRIVTIPGYDSCACCTPHVARTGEIGMLKIINVENYKGGLRLNILCGFRLLEYMNQLEEQTKKISKLLSVKVEAVASGVEQLKNAELEHKEEVVKCQRILARQRVEQISEQTTDWLEFDDVFSGIAFREYANLLIDKVQGVVYLLRGDDNEGYQYIIGSKKIDVRPIGKMLNSSCQGRGGGSSKMIQGTFQKSESVIRTCIAQVEV